MQEFLERIVYKKNAFATLQMDIEKYYYGKNVMVVSTKSQGGKSLTAILSALSLCKCAFKTYVSKRNFCFEDVCDVTEIFANHNFDLVIVLGAAKACDIARYFANVYNIPYFVCPTACSSLSYFGKLCIDPFNASRVIECDFAERIYIEETIIKTCPQFLVKQGLFCLLSLAEEVASRKILNVLFDKNNCYEEIEEIVCKTKRELCNILCGDGDGRLVLMDILIEAASVLCDFDFLKSNTYCAFVLLNHFCNLNGVVVCGGELMFVCCKTILSCYQTLFSLREIKKIDVASFSKIAKLINKFHIYSKNIKTKAYFEECARNKKLQIRLNNLKEEFLHQTNKQNEVLMQSMKEFKKYFSFFTYSAVELQDVLDVLTCSNYVFGGNYLLDVVCGFGYANKF